MDNNGVNNFSCGSLARLLREARTFKFDDFNDELGAHLEPSTSKDTNISLNKYRQLIYFGQPLIDLCKQYDVKQVFDVGCGLGHLLGWLADNSELDLIGIDYNKILCDRGANLYSKSRIYM